MLSIYAYRLSIRLRTNLIGYRVELNVIFVTRFSRCASAAAKPTIADVREINKTVRTLKSQYIDARFWPVKGPQRIIGMPDASYRNNADKSQPESTCDFYC